MPRQGAGSGTTADATWPSFQRSRTRSRAPRQSTPSVHDGSPSLTQGPPPPLPARPPALISLGDRSERRARSHPACGLPSAANSHGYGVRPGPHGRDVNAVYDFYMGVFLRRGIETKGLHAAIQLSKTGGVPKRVVDTALPTWSLRFERRQDVLVETDRRRDLRRFRLWPAASDFDPGKLLLPFRRGQVRRIILENGLRRSSFPDIGFPQTDDPAGLPALGSNQDDHAPLEPAHRDEARLPAVMTILHRGRVDTLLPWLFSHRLAWQVLGKFRFPDHGRLWIPPREQSK